MLTVLPSLWFWIYQIGWIPSEIKHELSCRFVTAGIQTENIRQCHTEWHADEEPTCNSWVWTGRSCWGPCTWPARQSALSGGRQRWAGANWPHTHLRKTGRNPHSLDDGPIRINNKCFLRNGCVKKEAHPSSWVGDTRPACTGPLVHWIAQSGPGPAGQRMAV